MEGEVIYVIVKRCFNLTRLLSDLTAMGNEDVPVFTLSRADETTSAIPDERDIFYQGRNFK